MRWMRRCRLYTICTHASLCCTVHFDAESAASPLLVVRYPAGAVKGAVRSLRSICRSRCIRIATASAFLDALAVHGSKHLRPVSARGLPQRASPGGWRTAWWWRRGAPRASALGPAPSAPRAPGTPAHTGACAPSCRTLHPIGPEHGRLSVPRCPPFGSVAGGILFEQDVEVPRRGQVARHAANAVQARLIGANRRVRRRPPKSAPPSQVHPQPTWWTHLQRLSGEPDLNRLVLLGRAVAVRRQRLHARGRRA